MEMMENLSGLPHSPTPPLTPITPSDFLPVRERIFYYFSPWPKGHRGAYIINIFYSLFYNPLTPCHLPYPIGGIYYQYILFPIFTVIIACPGGSCKAP
jgi:hypothetical protein